MSKDTGVGISASMRPRAIKKTKVHRVRNFGIPGLGRIAMTRDQGEASLFAEHFIRTNLKAVVRTPDGRLHEEYDLGSGLCTNVGVLALAADFGIPGVATTPANLFANLKFHAWGTDTTAAAKTDIKLAAPAAPTATEAEEGTNTLSANGEGKPKLISTGKIKAESTLAITEWGIHTQKKLSTTPATPKFTAISTTTATVTTAVTESTATAKGETLKIAVPTEAEEAWGLITKNTTTVLTVPAWYKKSNGAVFAPSATSAFTIKPVMFDHRIFSVINVESGNTIEFPWELTIESSN